MGNVNRWHRPFRRPLYLVSYVGFGPQSKFVLTCDLESVRLWDPQTSKESCRVISFTDGTWAVVDPDGRFDASNGGDVQGLHWVVGNEPIDLAQLKERYYDPGLLAKKMGFNKEPLRQVEAFTNPKLFPTVKLTEPTPDNPKLGITLTNRGGGIGRVVVKINGKELTADARAAGHDPNAQTMQLHVDLANDPRLKPGETNKIEVQAFNAEGYLRSRGLDFEYTPPGKHPPKRSICGRLLRGCRSIAVTRLTLRYADKDAEDFATCAEHRGHAAVHADRRENSSHVVATTQSDAAKQPTRENLIRALEAAKQSKPGDIFVVYLAGHGVNHGGQDSDFYFLTADAQSANLTDPDVRDQVALSAKKLTELIKHIPAQKQVLFLDTCAAGTAVQRLTENGDVPTSQIRALERVKDRTGLHILAGCRRERRQLRSHALRPRHPDLQAAHGHARGRLAKTSLSMWLTCSVSRPTRCRNSPRTSAASNGRSSPARKAAVSTSARSSRRTRRRYLCNRFGHWCCRATFRKRKFLLDVLRLRPAVDGTIARSLNPRPLGDPRLCRCPRHAKATA